VLNSSHCHHIQKDKGTGDKGGNYLGLKFTFRQMYLKHAAGFHQKTDNKAKAPSDRGIDVYKTANASV